MPNFRHGRQSQVLVNGFDLSAYLNNGVVGNTMAPADVTAYGNNSKAYIAGLHDATINFNGYLETSALGADTVLATALQAATDTNITFAPEGTAIGRHVYVLQADETKYEVTSPVANVVSVTADFQADIGAFSGESLHALGAETTTIIAASVDDGALSSVGGVGFVHVTAYSAFTNYTVKIRHSSDNISFVDLITFTAFTATGSQRAVISSGTTINRYLRVETALTGAGSITFQSSFARGVVS